MRVRELMGELVMFKNYPAQPEPEFNELKVKIRDNNGIEYDVVGVEADWAQCKLSFVITR